ncbi:MAG: hypothetical protein LBR93_01950 [Treponema sp.]|jgi:hypothetical protein|nr:hypothetical protein [Treponema sp.]
MKKSSLFLLGMLALTLAFGLVLTGCPTEDDDSSSGPFIPADLVGSWDPVSTSSTPQLIINADGSGYLSTLSGAWSVIGTTLTFSSGGESGSVTYSISGSGKLTLSNPTGTLYFYFMYITDVPLYKITSGGGGDNPPGSDIPDELIAVWYSDANSNGVLDQYEDIIVAYEFRSNGTLLIGGADSGYTFTVDGNQITMIFPGGIKASESITFNIGGNKLTLTGTNNSGFGPGNYLKK